MSDFLEEKADKILKELKLWQEEEFELAPDPRRSEVDAKVEKIYKSNNLRAMERQLKKELGIPNIKIKEKEKEEGQDMDEIDIVEALLMPQNKKILETKGYKIVDGIQHTPDGQILLQAPDLMERNTYILRLWTAYKLLK